MYFKEITVDKTSLFSWQRHDYFHFISFDEFDDILFPDNGLRNIFVGAEHYKGKIFSFDDYRGMNTRERFLWYLTGSSDRFTAYANAILSLYDQGKRIVGSTKSGKPHEFVMNYVLYLINVHTKEQIPSSLLHSYRYSNIVITTLTIGNAMKNANTRIKLQLYIRGKISLADLKEYQIDRVDYDTLYTYCKYLNILHKLDCMTFQEALDFDTKALTS